MKKQLAPKNRTVLDAYGATHLKNKRARRQYVAQNYVPGWYIMVFGSCRLFKKLYGHNGRLEYGSTNQLPYGDNP
jgi:hypothetical protein